MRDIASGKNMTLYHEAYNKDNIYIYEKKHVIKILPDDNCFKDIKEEIEYFTINIDNGYELIPSESRINRIKKKGYAVELIYASPKELKINFLNSPIKVKSIFIPLSDNNFPSDCVFIYESNKKFPHPLANTKQNKERLLRIIKDYK